MSEAPTPASPLEALKAGFRRACVRRLVGDDDGAVKVLRDDIPGLVVSWSKCSSLEASEKKAKLKEMFDDESGRADELAVAFDLFAGRFETRVADLVKKEVGSLNDRLLDSVQKLSLALSHVDQLSAKLSNLNQLNNSPSFFKSDKIEKDLENSAVFQKSPVKCVEDLSLEELDLEKRKIPQEPIKETPLPVERESTLQSLVTNDERKQTESSQSLDPPSGTGLRFDEIEEMIDEILSYDSK